MDECSTCIENHHAGHSVVNGGKLPGACCDCGSDPNNTCGVMEPCDKHVLQFTRSVQTLGSSSYLCGECKEELYVHHGVHFCEECNNNVCPTCHEMTLIEKVHRNGFPTKTAPESDLGKNNEIPSPKLNYHINGVEEHKSPNRNDSSSHPDAVYQRNKSDDDINYDVMSLLASSIASYNECRTFLSSDDQTELQELEMIKNELLSRLEQAYNQGNEVLCRSLTAEVQSVRAILNISLALQKQLPQADSNDASERYDSLIKGDGVQSKSDDTRGITDTSIPETPVSDASKGAKGNEQPDLGNGIDIEMSVSGDGWYDMEMSASGEEIDWVYVKKCGEKEQKWNPIWRCRSRMGLCLIM